MAETFMVLGQFCCNGYSDAPLLVDYCGMVYTDCDYNDPMGPYPCIGDPNYEPSPYGDGSGSGSGWSPPEEDPPPPCIADCVYELQALGYDDIRPGLCGCDTTTCDVYTMAELFMGLGQFCCNGYADEPLLGNCDWDTCMNTCDALPMCDYESSCNCECLDCDPPKCYTTADREECENNADAWKPQFPCIGDPEYIPSTAARQQSYYM
jgi:hypothetical protein